ncbi:hypothetical protein XENTR_v10018929 [Xenopus tropicalis]|nr:hypothetical protein XENTR_v10018929 [Xenopus tropicalis]|eukprot:XP_017950700.1 PREDICTED: 39S ribosomal protein L20, mitochondrial isoform X1 [Xenopus tropicalis]
MVFLSLSRWVRSRGPDRYWRVQEVLKHARHFRGRKNRCFSLAVRAVRRAFVYSTKARKAKKRIMRACQVALNRKVISDMAIYEPKTFKSLAALAKRRRDEGILAALGDGKEPEGIFSRVVNYH